MFFFYISKMKVRTVRFLYSVLLLDTYMLVKSFNT